MRIGGGWNWPRIVFSGAENSVSATSCLVILD
jgi:hypothetical protein